MTKKGIENIVKRYTFIRKAMGEGKDTAVFYIGNRKKSIYITVEVKMVCEIIDEIYSQSDNWIKLLIDGLRKGYSDRKLILRLPWEKNAYYERKHKFIDKIYKCCIYRNMVEYDEIISEEI